MAQTAHQSLRHTISIRYLISFRTKISATESGDDNHASGNVYLISHSPSGLFRTNANNDKLIFK